MRCSLQKAAVEFAAAEKWHDGKLLLTRKMGRSYEAELIKSQLLENQVHQIVRFQAALNFQDTNYEQIIDFIHDLKLQEVCSFKQPQAKQEPGGRNQDGKKDRSSPEISAFIEELNLNKFPSV